MHCLNYEYYISLFLAIFLALSVVINVVFFFIYFKKHCEIDFFKYRESILIIFKLSSLTYH